MTTYTIMGSLSSPTEWTKDWPVQSDNWAWLDEVSNRMADENDNVIIFHTGDFYDKQTEWAKA